ncbi:MAG: hypothetical protein H8F28_15760, partial [Fibrella sp.]|nr:hypothetical protein [Armatimonadota bacterium]
AAEAQIAGTDTSNRHTVFDQLGQQMQRAVTFDMGTVPVDKTFAAIEASLDAQTAQQRTRAERKPAAAKPLRPIEIVEDMALMTTPPRTAHSPTTMSYLPGRSSVESYMMSGEIPLDPGAGGRSIPVSTLEIGDIIVSTTKEIPSRLIRFGTGAPISHAMLYVGGGQVVEAIGEGVVQRSVEAAIAGSYLAVAFRHPFLTPEQQLLVRDHMGQHVGKPFNYVGIVRQAGFQLDRLVFCGGKTGDDYDRCVRWVGQVNLGTATNDRFFCSESVLKSYEAAGIPLTTTPPNYNSPGDIAELHQSGMLAYVGHLKYEP